MEDAAAVIGESLARVKKCVARRAFRRVNIWKARPEFKDVSLSTDQLAATFNPSTGSTSFQGWGLILKICVVS